MTPSKDPVSSKSKISEILKSPENSNPNTFNGKTPLPKTVKSKTSAPKTPARSRSQPPELSKPSENASNLPDRSPSVKLVESKKIGPMKPRNADPGNLVCNMSPSKPIRGRKFIKKNSRNHMADAASEDLGTLQEEFSLSNGLGSEANGSRTKDEVNATIQPSLEEGIGALTGRLETQDAEKFDSPDEMGTSKMKKKRSWMLEATRCSVPKTGRVMNLVKAFEGILSISNSESSEEKEVEEFKNSVKWALPGSRVNVEESEICTSSFSSSDLLFPSRSSDSDSGISSSFDSSNERDVSILCVPVLSNLNLCAFFFQSSESSGRTDGRKRDKQLKVTCQQPFKLRTEQRGKSKKEEFHKKLEEMIMEEQKLRIPIAHGLPWTTDEPECLVKPPVKESTQPLELKLRSDLRAIERAEFDHVIAEKVSLMEQYRLEREKQKKV
ncbi:hypothetical protein ACLOJK_038510 [Asimina triloba]